ncbi:MAG: addiction module protein [Isosphaeraceae bacterium]
MGRTMVLMGIGAWRTQCAERAELAAFLIESLDQQVDVDTEAAWESEFLGGANEIRNKRAEGVSASQVFAEPCFQGSWGG